MTTAQEVEQYADTFGDSYPATVVYLRQYATILRQTTEGTDALVAEHCWENRALNAERELLVAQQRLKVVEAENARLKAAMDKYSEDEMLLIERCAKVCEQIETESRVKYKQNYSGYWDETESCVKYKQDYSGYWEGSCDGAGDCVVEIRALKVERSPYEVMAEGNHSIGVFKDGKLIAADADVFMPPKERRKGERRIKCNRGYPIKRSGTDRRKK